MQILSRLLILILAASLCVTAHSQSLDNKAKLLPEIGAALMLSKSLQRMANTCSVIYPPQEVVYQGIYQASSAPRYLLLFNFETELPLVTGSQDERLQALDLSEKKSIPFATQNFHSKLTGSIRNTLIAIKKSSYCSQS
ncbi:hypothetical protein [Microbulbifer aggregans]|uniref:hypothetical protein n=1 Tax=Microbulbifer aggregans TaxID=1769779 RepID=UPI001CFE9DF6|nr:hypothetical protein [Microbulbifer aggregans]